MSSPHHRRRTAFAALLALVLAMGVMLAGPADAHRGHRINPVIFVHGFAGSGAQFESQQLRLTANGYPSRFIRVLEYDSTFSQQSMADVHAALDALVGSLREQTRAARVDILGHSLGTTVMHGYLSSPARAANVAHYVNIDGRPAAAPPGGVPTLAIWAGRGAPGRAIEGAVNVTIPNQTHVEVATSAESFVEIYRFLTGRSPATSHVVPERDHWVTVSGRALNFPVNTGVSGATLQIWRVSGHTGQRVRRHPVAVRPLGGDGSWGPVRLQRGAHHEFAIVRDDGTATHHFYYEPFVRSDHLVRLLTSPPGTGLDALVERSERHVSLVVTRNKELWGDQGGQSDIVRVDGTNIVNPATAPIGKLVIGMFAFDRGSDGVTDTSAPIPAFFATPFISGVDVFMPATRPSTGRVSVTLTSRGAGPPRTVNFPNFPSTTDRVTVQFNDYEPFRR